MSSLGINYLKLQMSLEGNKFQCLLWATPALIPNKALLLRCLLSRVFLFYAFGGCLDGQ
jgi:hypothetical protein